MLSLLAEKKKKDRKWKNRCVQKEPENKQSEKKLKDEERSKGKKKQKDNVQKKQEEGRKKLKNLRFNRHRPLTIFQDKCKWDLYRLEVAGRVEVGTVTRKCMKAATPLMSPYSRPWVEQVAVSLGALRLCSPRGRLSTPQKNISIWMRLKRTDNKRKLLVHV